MYFLTTRPVWALCLLALVVGVVTGLGAVLFRDLIGFIHNLFFLGRLSTQYDANLFTPAGPWGPFVILVPVVGGIIAGKMGGPAAMPTKQDPNALVTATPEQQVAAIKEGLTYLKKQCLKGVDSQLIVEWVENNAEDYQPLIHNVLNLPFEKFVEIDAEIGNEPFKQWFTGLFNGLRSAFVPDNTVGMDSPGEHGDIDDAGNHGDTGTNPKRKGK